MNSNFRQICISTTVLVSALAVASAPEAPPTDRVPVERARAAAIKAYAGAVQAEELEFEAGKWIYSFDLKKPNDRRVHEVHVDARTGQLLNIHAESAADEIKEQKEDAK